MYRTLTTQEKHIARPPEGEKELRSSSGGAINSY